MWSWSAGYDSESLDQCVVCCSLLKVCRSVLRIVFVLLNNIYCIPTYAVWMLLLQPLKRYNPDLYWRIEGVFFHWLLAMVSMWSWSAGYDSESTLWILFKRKMDRLKLFCCQPCSRKLFFKNNLVVLNVLLTLCDLILFLNFH